MKDLAPAILRQRLIIEGYPGFVIEPSHIKEYLSKLSKILKMRTLTEPVASQSPKFGWAGWIHWETSGAHFYGWRKPILFFSVDIYTCKAFSSRQAVVFTRAFFRAKQTVFKSV